MEYDAIVTPEELLEFMNENIKYGFEAEDGTIYDMSDPEKLNEAFTEKWHLMNPDRLKVKKIGTCWDQAEFESRWFSDNKYEFRTIFVMFTLPYENAYTTHAYLIYRDMQTGKWNYFEHADEDNRGITYGFDTIFDAVRYQAKLHVENNKKYYGIKDEEVEQLKVFTYRVPRYHLSCEEFLNNVLDGGHQCDDITECLTNMEYNAEC